MKKQANRYYTVLMALVLFCVGAIYTSTAMGEDAQPIVQIEDAA